MNEKKIQALAEQAYLGPCCESQTVAIKKFAELIVWECASEIRKQGDGESLDDWDRGYEAGLISAINALHKHFGIE